MKEKAPQGLTGGLRGSITYSFSEEEVDIEATAPYAKYVAKGRGEVKPVHAKALSNLYTGDGSFGPVAHAKASKAQPFDVETAHALASEIHSLF